MIGYQKIHLIVIVKISKQNARFIIYFDQYILHLHLLYSTGFTGSSQQGQL